LDNTAVACLIFNNFLEYKVNNKDIRLDLLRKLEENPKYTQRELSKEMGVSLGKVNYCMKKLIEKGMVKLLNFSHNEDKVSYIYLLTPKGIENKSKLTIEFLKIKIKEYEILKEEIDILKQDVNQLKFKKTE
jgi:EPS-associated MarR family transcriptional regulator